MKSQRPIWLLLICLIITAVLSYLNLAEVAVPDKPTEILSTPIAAIDPTTEATIQGIGFIEPSDEIHRLNFRSPGVIKSVLVKAGDYVQEGKVLAELHSERLRAELQVLMAKREVAKTNLAEVITGKNPLEIASMERMRPSIEIRIKYWSDKLNRLEALRRSKAAPEDEFQICERERATAEVELETLNARIRHYQNFSTEEQIAHARSNVTLCDSEINQLQSELQETKLIAPFTGTVLEVLKREGEASR